MSEFRFSPRPNRAAEIGWMPWGAQAFARATAEDKPILLSISAVWCHWCHVMDETSYSDAGVIDAIKRSYVPVRVDNDRRPDVNARYNMGGWPTTAFLAPDGTTLSGATYLPPQQMRRALDEIARFYAERKDEIAEHTVALQAGGALILRKPQAIWVTHRSSRSSSSSSNRTTTSSADSAKRRSFRSRRFTSSCSPSGVSGRTTRLYDMTARTMLAMSRGGMYDHVEGGFFRYSTTRDWSVPHFEKMAEDHAGLLRVFAELALFAPTQEFHATLVSALGYVCAGAARSAGNGFFGGSQDADEEYYALPLEERSARGEPYVDRTSYTNWTCALAGAQCLCARALDDDALLTKLWRRSTT